jgi:hypothetical protein
VGETVRSDRLVLQLTYSGGSSSTRSNCGAAATVCLACSHEIKEAILSLEGMAIDLGKQTIDSHLDFDG